MTQLRERISMKVGITYDLRNDYLIQGFSEEETAEFDRPETIEAIEQALQELGYETDRIGNIKHLANRLVSGDSWDIVFNIAEGLYGLGREAQVPALLDAYSIPYTFSDALVLTLTLHKGFTKHVVRDLGILTPDFMIVESESDIGKIDLPFPLFIKPVAEGTGKGITAASKVVSSIDLDFRCRHLLTQFNQPILVETFLPGREFTVGLVGTGPKAVAVGVIEVTLKDGAERDAYSYLNKETYEQTVAYHLVEGQMAEEAKKLALNAWRGLGCRDAGRIDLRADANGFPNFMEVNPLAGMHPIRSDLPILCTLNGIAYLELINMIMQSALSRISKSI
jgi:D-alanine-D-alanine ligase